MGRAPAARFSRHPLGQGRPSVRPPTASSIPYQEIVLATRSCIARPTPTGFEGIYVHWDGYPTHHLPLLLAAHQFRFKGDIEAMARFLVDSPEVSWDHLGADLLTDAPEPVQQRLGNGYDACRPTTGLVTLDGSPVQRMTFDEVSAQESWLSWAYVLRPEGVEVASLQNGPRGLLVGWDVDPLTPFTDDPERWRPRAASRSQAPTTTVRKAEPRAQATKSATRR
ncbi:hypothetical protein [Streptomyces sp. NBC_01244]|uniref:hypothetical protein n=1 Tax=Streptomyces sp. NBC_01244 TaxID=2903797 RepID=UPI002E10510C|nr:hypothetical protein OG247_31785 [Streptomyces sp. NBC_01244]